MDFNPSEKISTIIYAIPLSWFAYLVAKRISFFKPLTETRPPLNILWALSGILFALFFQFLIGPISYSYFAPHGISPIFLSVWATLIGSLAILGFSRLIPPHVKTAIFGKVSFVPFFKGTLTWFLVVPFVFVLAGVLELAVHYVFNAPPQEQVAVLFVKKTLGNPPLFSAVVLMVTLFVPWVEEFLFRGCLQSFLSSKLPRKWSIIATSVVFALVHFSTSQGYNNIEILTSLFFLSLILGYLYEREGSLFASFGLHAMFNSMTIVFLLHSN